MEKIAYPIRINRYLALQNHCSRREADTLIAKGLVLINGRKALMGEKMQATDKVEIKKSDKQKMKELVYLAFNKPRGIVTHSPVGDQQSIHQITNIGNDIFPIGRLDRDSHGLILLTNDGRLTDKLLNPKYDHEKEYLVKVDKPITKHFLKIMATGVQLEDCTTKPSTITQKNEFSFYIILTEGKKHQIRRMCSALGYTTLDLKRVRIMNIKLGNLPIGHLRKIEGVELKNLLRKIGLLD